mgnify:CR=1 FL=1
MLAVIASDCCAVTPSFAVLASIASDCYAVMTLLTVLAVSAAVVAINVSV